MDSKIDSDFYKNIDLTMDNLTRCYLSLVVVVMHFKGIDHILPPPDYEGDKYKWIDKKVREILDEARKNKK